MVPEELLPTFVRGSNCGRIFGRQRERQRKILQNPGQVHRQKGLEMLHPPQVQIIRKGFGQHQLNTKKFMNQEEFEEFHECIAKVNLAKLRFKRVSRTRTCI